MIYPVVKSLSHVQLFATPWTVAYEAPPSIGFSRQEYWSGLPFPSLGDLPNPGIEPRSPALYADALLSEPSGKSNLTNSVFKIMVIRMLTDVRRAMHKVRISTEKENIKKYQT